jgi:hypothetical protein
MVDAEFAFSAGGMGMDMVGMVDVGIDTGMLWPNRPTRFYQVAPGPRMKWNPVPQVNAPPAGSMQNTVSPGALFRSDSTYYMIAIGNGKPLSLKLTLPGGATGSGAIAVSLYALSPAPPHMFTPMHSLMPAPPPPPKTCAGAALDSVAVPAAMPSMTIGKFTTDASKLYLLQASGTAPTGAASIGDGDAEYMDFGPVNDPTLMYPTYNGYNDGEACADFGLGVDEFMPTHCGMNNVCVHRKWWWGTVGIAPGLITVGGAFTPTYRNDHIYYMIYPGTGKPIGFGYFDSGYGDNKPPEAVLAMVYPLP